MSTKATPRPPEPPCIFPHSHHEADRALQEVIVLSIFLARPDVLQLHNSVAFPQKAM